MPVESCQSLADESLSDLGIVLKSLGCECISGICECEAMRKLIAVRDGLPASDLTGPRIFSILRCGDWLLIEYAIPVPVDAPDDVMYMSVFAKIVGKKLVEYQIEAPSEWTNGVSVYPPAQTP